MKLTSTFVCDPYVSFKCPTDTILYNLNMANRGYNEETGKIVIKFSNIQEQYKNMIAENILAGCERVAHQDAKASLPFICLAYFKFNSIR